MATNSGVSKTFPVTGEVVKLRKYHKISGFDLTEVSPPVISGNEPSVSMIKWVTPWPEISFEKICYPKYDGVGQYTGIITNKPDFINDYHFIALMRNIDWYCSPTYKSVIVASMTTPQSAYASRTIQIND